MIDGSEKRNRQLGFELQNSHVCETRSTLSSVYVQLPVCQISAKKTNKSWPLSKLGWTLFIHEPRLDAANRNVGILNLRLRTNGISSFRSIPGRTDNEHVHKG